MIEDNNINNNLREAIHREELSRPPMPKDLNTRLMQRVEKEVNTKHKRKHIAWSWIAAACVAAFIAIVLHQVPSTPKGEPQIAHVAKDSMKQNEEKFDNKEPQPLTANTKHELQAKQEEKAIGINSKKPLMARAECVVKEEARQRALSPEVPAQTQQDLAVADNADKPAATPTANQTTQPRILTERDIPVTRPENLKYTKEELALMRKQANEAYLKWMELELEIARYNQEQTALK